MHPRPAIPPIAWLGTALAIAAIGLFFLPVEMNVVARWILFWTCTIVAIVCFIAAFREYYLRLGASPVSPQQTSRRLTEAGARKGILDFIGAPLISREAAEAFDHTFLILDALASGPPGLQRRLDRALGKGEHREARAIGRKLARWYARRVPTLQKLVDHLSRRTATMGTDRLDQIRLIIASSHSLVSLRQGEANWRDTSRDLCSGVERLRAKSNTAREAMTQKIPPSADVGLAIERLIAQVVRLEGVISLFAKSFAQEHHIWTSALRDAFARDYKAAFPDILSDPVAVRILTSFKGGSRSVNDVAIEFQQEQWEARVYLGCLHAARLVIPIIEEPYTLEANKYGLDQEGRHVLDEIELTHHPEHLTFVTEDLPLDSSGGPGVLVRVRTAAAVATNVVAILVSSCVDDVKVAFIGASPSEQRDVTIGRCSSSAQHNPHYVMVIFTRPTFTNGVTLLIEMRSRDGVTVLDVKRQRGSEMLPFLK